MSHASANPVTPHSARITEAAPTRPVLVVETLDHSLGSTMLFAYTYDMEAAPADTAQFTLCAQPGPADTAQFTFCAQPGLTDTAQFTFCAQPGLTDTAQFTFCAQTAPDTTQFTFCAQTSPTDAFGAETTAPVAVEDDAVVGSWR